MTLTLYFDFVHWIPCTVNLQRVVTKKQKTKKKKKKAQGRRAQEHLEDTSEDFQDSPGAEDTKHNAGCGRTGHKSSERRW